ncbi:hypothetical protein C8A00DRAFT_36020 [Chaetomidium leptoderma]|uniref:BTB domain-containing protein n=1 Tax=Chaetomidium leptoderma TaxID=669021 RepID=A0AAN6VGV3_9PEZI|nr:hypothetical protein C8A00DRAFT_36020 [Chaetomidium leptoderma]
MAIRKFELETKLKNDNQLIRTGALRNEHPMDSSSEFLDFLQACRRGDLKQCQQLITAGVNINAKDEYDYTPLVVASLCGHYELVRLLLESGALADPDSFERERAVYNALNNKIRNLLLSYDYSKTVDLLQPWSSHIASLLVRETPSTSDITLSAVAEDFRLHKFLLSARSPYFMRKFADAPETVTWKLPHAIPVEAFRVVLRYLYLGDLPRDFVGPGSSVAEEEVFRGIDKLCKQLEIEKLWEAVLSINDRRLARQRQQDEVQRAQGQVEDFFRNTVLKHRIEVDTRKAGDVKWPHHNAIFADCLLRADEQLEDEDDADTENVSNGNAIPVGPARDSGPKTPRRSVLYPVHKPFLIRSPYFETMFSSDFIEAHDTEHLHIIKVDCAPAVLEIVLRFLYTEKADCALEHALELLYTADMLLLEKLKTKAAVTISTLGSGTSNALVDRTHNNNNLDQQPLPEPTTTTTTTTTKESTTTANPTAAAAAAGEEAVEIEPVNVYDVIHAAWDLKVQRLEEFAARYLASRLEDYIDDDEFAELIRESASRLKERQETDTIELLDDIRYYLSERFRFRFEGEGLEELLNGGEDAMGGGGGGGGGDDEEAVVDKEVVVDKEAVKVGDAKGRGGGVRTLNGDVVEDEFASDAVNYQILLDKIETMLETLKLGA